MLNRQLAGLLHSLNRSSSYRRERFWPLIIKIYCYSVWILFFAFFRAKNLLLKQNLLLSQNVRLFLLLKRLLFLLSCCSLLNWL